MKQFVKALVAVLVCVATAAVADIRLGDAKRNTVLSTPDSVTGAIAVAIGPLATTQQVSNVLTVATNALGVANAAVKPNETGGVTLTTNPQFGMANSRFDSIAVGEKVVVTNAPTYVAGGNSRSQSFAIGFGSEARAYRSFALGERAITRNTLESQSFGYGEDYAAFVWSGQMFDEYFGHGTGTFSIDPYGGLGGFWIGEDRMSDLLNAKANTNSLSVVAKSGQYADLIGAPFLPSWPSVDIATNITWTVVVSNGHWLVYGTETTP